MSSRIFIQRPLSKLILCCKTLGRTTERRWLFSAAFLKLESFEKRKVSLEQRLEFIKEKFLTQVENLVQDSKGVIFKGDLHLMIHIADTEKQMEIVEKLASCYVTQNENARIEGEAGVGANLMRMCHLANNWNFACRLIQNETLKNADMFTLTSKCILGDMLFENGQYDKLVELGEEWTKRERPSASIVFLLYATYLKQNTRESFEKMAALGRDFQSRNSFSGIYSNGPYIGAVLALRQNEPEVAMEMLEHAVSAHGQRLSPSRALLLLWAQAEVGKLDDFSNTIDDLKSSVAVAREMPIYLRLLERNSLVLDQDVVNSIKAALSKHEDAEKREMCLSKVSALESYVVLEAGSIDQALIKRVGQSPRQKRPASDFHSMSSDSDSEGSKEEAHL